MNVRFLRYGAVVDSLARQRKAQTRYPATSLNARSTGRRAYPPMYDISTFSRPDVWEERSSE
jgi:hypothetical protein